MNRSFMAGTTVINTYIPIVAWITCSEPDISGQEYADDFFHSPKLHEMAAIALQKCLFF